jgi:hypothetical protein
MNPGFPTFERWFLQNDSETALFSVLNDTSRPIQQEKETCAKAACNIRKAKQFKQIEESLMIKR